jgi:hypothetical protein
VSYFLSCLLRSAYSFELIYAVTKFNVLLFEFCSMQVHSGSVWFSSFSMDLQLNEFHEFFHYIGRKYIVYLSKVEFKYLFRALNIYMCMT